MKLNLDFKAVPLLYRPLKKKKKIEITFHGKTLKDLTEMLVDQYGPAVNMALLDETGDIDLEIKVFVNEVIILFDNRMDAVIEDGDTIAFAVGG